ncbi:MAG TPA: ATP-binding protein [Oxalicibacterium sp.]|nr:ATP-binding protein [Oxalicibacterium sp.]
MRIRSRLLILVISVLIPALLMTGVGVVYVYTEAQNANRQSMREVTQALALVVDKEISEREAILRTLATSPALDNGDLASFYQQAQRLVTAPSISIMLSDPAGHVLLNTRIAGGIPDLPASSMVRELRRQHRVDATLVSNIYKAPLSQRQSFLIQVPVKRDGQVIYYLEMGVFVSELQSVFTEQQLPDGWLGTIVDRNGVVVARSSGAATYVGHHATGPILQKMAAQQEGFNEGVALSGERVSAFFSRAPHSEWRFIVSVPQREIEQSAIDAATMIGGLSLLLLAIAVVAAVGGARHTAKSVEQLMRSAQSLGKAEAVAPLKSGVREFDAVSDAMVNASAELRRARVDLERRVAEAVAIAERSQRAVLQGQKLEALGRLTGGIAHDFNNVLQTLTTGLQVCLMSAGTERERNLLEACQRAVQRGVELARQLMVFGRVQDARLETLQLEAQLKLVVPMLTATLPGDIHFNVKLMPALWNITVDPLQLELALLNLTMNARAAMPNGGSITLEAYNETIAAHADLPPGDYVCLHVRDNGSGMSEEVSTRALDPFYTTKDVGQGSGMGLSQAYGFAKQSGGTLSLFSEPGVGTVVTLYLPRSTKPLEPQQAEGSSLPSQHASASMLFVEDDPLVRETVAPALRAAGWDVEVACSGEEALRVLQAGATIRLVFSDIVMPGSINGIDLARIVRDHFPDTRIVLATGYSERRIDLPGVPLLAKPYSMPELIAALNNALPPGE